MSKPKAPKAPNYTNLANQQSDLAKQQWQRELTASRPDQIGPTGSTTWKQDPTTGQWTQNTALNQGQQNLFNAQEANQQNLAGSYGKALGGYDTSQVDLSGAPAMPAVGGYNQQVIDTLRQLQAPQLAKQRAAREAALTAQGVGTGTGEIWTGEQKNLGDIENTADLNSIMQGIGQGNVEYGQGMQGHQQGVSDILAQKNANLAQLQGLYGQTAGVQMPQFSSFNTPTAGAGATPDLLGAAGQQYNAAVQKYNSKGPGIMGGLMGLAGTAIGSMAGPIGAGIGGQIGGMFGGGNGGTSAYSPNGIKW